MSLVSIPFSVSARDRRALSAGFAMVAMVGSVDGTRTARVSVQGETAEAAASRAAEALIEKGAEAILAEASRP